MVVITGTSSGLGRKTAQALLRTGQYHVIGAVRDLDKMDVVAELDGFNKDNFTPMHCELNSFESVSEMCDKVKEFSLGKPIDRLICNAGVYQPTLPYAKWSKDGHEQTMQINFLSHFLMIRYVQMNVDRMFGIISTSLLFGGFKLILTLSLLNLNATNIFNVFVVQQQTNGLHDRVKRCASNFSWFRNRK